MIVNLENKSMDMEEREWNYIMPAYVRTYLFSAKNEDPEKIIFPMFPTVPHPTKPGVSIPVEYVAMDSPVAKEIAQDGSNVAEVTPAQEAELDAKDDEIIRLKKQLAEMEASTPYVAANYTPPEPEVDADYEVAKADMTPAPEDLLRQEEEAKLAYEASEEAAAVAEAEAAGELESAPPARPPMDAAFGETKTATPPPPDRKPNLPSVVIPPGQSLDNMGSRDNADQLRVAKDLAIQPEIDESKERPAEIAKPEEE